MKHIPIRDFFIGKKELTVICGPCVIEDPALTFSIAERLKEIFSDIPAHFIFKSSFDKANRSSIRSYRGPGMKKGLEILEKIKKELDIPVLTDVHTPTEAKAAGAVCDMIQIPAFLCRQTDLLVAAGQSKAAVNIKKGQFVAPWDMKYVLEKVRSTSNEKILLTDRGTCFGYNNLVSDMRSIPIMQSLGYPVCFDATHSVQLPGGAEKTGGQREFIPHLAKAAIAAGANALFIECHPSPKKAKSDASSMLDLNALPKLLHQVLEIYKATRL